GTHSSTHPKRPAVRTNNTRNNRSKIAQNRSSIKVRYNHLISIKALSRQKLAMHDNYDFSTSIPNPYLKEQKRDTNSNT
ncbi:hypothetical protein, partial [Spartinivicinus marinus]|uniref:hypothetical protein n=1 Tax=Spartinivicinus marinus TaxID=2994442 RepID=UPI001C5C8574